MRIYLSSSDANMRDVCSLCSPGYDWAFGLACYLLGLGLLRVYRRTTRIVLFSSKKSYHISGRYQAPGLKQRMRQDAVQTKTPPLAVSCRALGIRATYASDVANKATAAIPQREIAAQQPALLGVRGCLGAAEEWSLCFPETSKRPSASDT